MWNTIFPTVLILLNIVIWQVSYFSGKDAGFDQAHEGMLDNCFENNWVYITVGKTTYAFNCNTDKGSSSMTVR
jgi:hypothetical protein